MVKPGFDRDPVLGEFRRLYRKQNRLIAPSVFDDEAAAALRERLIAAGLSAFFVADRGRYALNASLIDGLAFTSLRSFAEPIVESKLELAAGRWLRFSRGDYQLIRGDAVERPLRGRHLELTLDFSAGDCEQAETVYTDGAQDFVVPQWRNSVTLVERHDSLYRYERYLNHLVGDAQVYRLRLSLRFA